MRPPPRRAPVRRQRGVALLLASVIAGLLWDTHGAAVTFMAGAGFAAAAAVLIRFVEPAPARLA